MRDELARDVLPVLRQALLFRDRLLHRRPLELEMVQSHLRGLLNAFPAERRDTEYLGVQFPVIAWLDEINCLECGDPNWQRKWSDHTLEWEYYSTKDRAHLFWDQARQASGRNDRDIMEVFYLCMLLGFRGDLRDDPRHLADWREKFENLIDLKQAPDWPEMPHRLQEPEADVPELTAKESLRWVLLAWAVAISGLIVALSFVTARFALTN